MKKISYILLILVSCLFHSTVFGDDYVIGESDTLFVSVWGNEKLSVSVTVRPDGKITIPALGEVLASGRTPTHLQQELTILLKSLVKEPIVTVSVEVINNNKVYIFGGGVEPGVYSLNGRTTLLQLLCMVKGAKNADLQKAYVMRGGEKIKEDFHPLFIKGESGDDVLIKVNDIVFIPAFEDNNIYILGAVINPTVIQYREGMKVMEAILAAGGFTKFARENSTTIFRKISEEETTINVKLEDLMDDGSLSQNIELQPGDHVVVKEGIL